MKTKALHAVAAIGLSALLVGSASAQTAVSKPVGYVTETLTPGFNLMGVTLHNKVSASASVTAISGTTITVADGVVDGLVDGQTYILEVTSGSGLGAVQVFTTFDAAADTITTIDDLSSEVSTGDSLVIRKASTIADVFGAANESGLLGAAAAASADNILVPDGSGGFVTYFYSTGGFFWHRLESRWTRRYGQG